MPAIDPLSFHVERRPRCAVLADETRPQVARRATALRSVIEQHLEVAVWDLAYATDLTALDLDLVVVLGGDGSILRAARHMGRRQLPVLGVNLGKLGFLADLSPDELASALPLVCAGKCRVVEHLMFECQHLRNGRIVDAQPGLNELVIVAGAPFTILEVHLCVDAESVTTYSCDGLIISTPVGSTAHNLSAGGPILRKDLQAFVISPISAHTLTNRPVVDSADRVYEFEVANPNPGTAVVVDGRPWTNLERGDRVRVSRAEARFQLLEVPDHSYYRTLREKLGWGGQLQK